MRVRIAGARVVDPASGIDEISDVYVAEGRVQAIGKAPDGFTAERELQATGRILIPGIVDLRARLREPGAEHKATIASETRAAVRGGITTLCCPPDTDPVIDTPAVAELIHQRAAESRLARVEVLGALTRDLDGQNLAEMGALKEAGCLGVSNALAPVTDTEVMLRAMEYAVTFGLTVFVHAEDARLAAGRLVHDGPVATRLGLPGIPEIAETIGVARDLLLVEQTGARVHFCHLSTGPAVDMVRDARSHGLPVSADVAIHQLLLTEADIDGFDADCHVRPPLRSVDDRARLRAGVRAGVIGSICSDHQPHEVDAKLNPFPQTEPGISSLDSLLSLVLGLVEDDELTLSQAVAALTSGPCAVLGIDRGSLAVGAAADLCVFDPHERWVLDDASMLSRGHNTPFKGHRLAGRVCLTMVDGRVVFEAPPA
ncbi:MAG: dihydroorotase [Gammaproteobacteria bacterium]|nr:dihydroorotase [Gammaproteobacteria bacterium]NIR21753.1 dihydroorotase [Gammaproteobacteria bacterium]NIS03457.1 dihydroorotase [Gammaproteobacteria bacterium]NIU39950.1 dihydroorotase [Gammaproteobacteria bacterium]NIV45339.1 dihydroorotase [Gammaproteobacteria bacterium]